MPSRQRTRTIQTPSVQPPDGWIRVKAITLAEARAFQNTMRPLERESDELNEQLMELDYNLPENKTQIESIEKRLAEINQETGKMFADYVTDWNWVGDDDKPLDKPAGNPTVFELLTLPEIKIIGDAINANDEGSQKKGSSSRRR